MKPAQETLKTGATGPKIGVAGMLFGCGFLVGLVQLIHPIGFSFGPGFETASVARSLAQRGVFGNPFEPAITGPTAVVPPLHSILMAGVFRLFSPPCRSSS